MAGKGGLDPGEVDELLAGDCGAAEAREWEQQGRRLGISGVPYFVMSGRVALSGAQPPELFLKAFEPAGEAVAAGEACESDPGTRKRAAERPGLLQESRAPVTVLAK